MSGGRLTTANLVPWLRLAGVGRAGAGQAPGALLRSRVTQAHMHARSLASSSTPSPGSAYARFWAWTTRPTPEFLRFSQAWWGEQAFRCGVFAVTGSSSLLLLRPVLRTALQEPEGSLMQGPNTYRAASLLFLSPAYAVTLCAVGTAAGRHVFFASMGAKILGRFMPRSVSQRILCASLSLSLS
eukprot:CAMPEP_0180414860 /NCGR_PEP_ID=MMETSP0989-20121125/45884_1 /TAXON_ID=697907 /ORGANISM="non described non described, Strain CCMP2293" /LENGTH=183 /DNA_ID=CAMNT_0022419591 /DNA_START=174 /DNA_END=721 /DNA_ORIENTATION=-